MSVSLFKSAALGLASVLGLAGCAPPSDVPSGAWGGWAEGEPLLLAAPVAGRVASQPQGEGTSVAAGALLFSLDGALEREAVGESAARTRSAALQASDALSGKRPAELAVIEAQARSARAQASLAAQDMARKQALASQGFVSPAQVQDADATLRAAQARVGEAQAALQAARLPAREGQRGAAQAQAVAAAQQQAQAAWRLAQTVQTAPQAGLVQTIYLRPGEWAAAGQPVLALLPPGARKAVFFVPEAVRGTLAPGQRVRLSCDGCGEPIAARITQIAPQVEYTPPVIYSNSQRAALVFRAEARPEREADALRLHPGQPLDVRVAHD